MGEEKELNTRPDALECLRIAFYGVGGINVPLSRKTSKLGQNRRRKSAIPRKGENEDMKMKIKLDGGAYLSERAHETDAGYDLRTPHRVVLHPHSSVTVDTGVHVQIPEGCVGFLKAKSGLNVKHDITGTGVIDSGYTGSIRVKLYNNGDMPHVFDVGDKLIQLVILPILTPELELVDELEDTERGSNGFGSTGR